MTLWDKHKGEKERDFSFGIKRERLKQKEERDNVRKKTNKNDNYYIWKRTKQHIGKFDLSRQKKSLIC